MPRLLFVDDERRVLSGLRRQLHGCRDDWNLDFAPGGAEALAAVAEARYDVVVTDMRMPGVDGAAVLSAVAERLPRAARLMLSGFADGNGGGTVGSGAHRFLDKPCETTSLLSSIEEVIDVRRQLDDVDDPMLEQLWRRSPATVDELPEMLEVILGRGRPAAELANELLTGPDERWLAVVAAAVRADVLGLDATPRDVLARLGATSVVALTIGRRLHQAVGGDWTGRVASATAMAVAAHAAGRGRELGSDELAEVLLAAFLVPLTDDGDRWPLLEWLLRAWDLPSRAVLAVSPEGTADDVGRALAAARAAMALRSPQSESEETLT